MSNDRPDPELTAFAVQIADQVESFLISLQAIAASEESGREVSLLLLEVSQVLLAGARLGAQMDFAPREQFQPDVGGDPDIDDLRLRVAELFGGLDTYSFNFDPYVPDLVEGVLSDDLASVATDLEYGLRHYKNGDVEEALWWWQFSYVSTWGSTASAVLRALQSIVTHDRLDADLSAELDEVEAEQVAVADQILGATD